MGFNINRIVNQSATGIYVLPRILQLSENTSINKKKMLRRNREKTYISGQVDLQLTMIIRYEFFFLVQICALYVKRFLTHVT